MSITHHLSFTRTAITILLATILTTLISCSDDDTATNPNIKFTDSYKVEYVPGTMDPAQGKTQFQISLTDRSTGLPAEGITVTLMPLMYMTDKTHSTPVDGACLEDASGVYDCTIFYVMADTMNGVSTGHWELEVMLDGMTSESAMFYPSVGMAMGGTAMAKQFNSNLTMNMMGDIKLRTFHVFKSSLMGTTGNHTFELFTSTMESMDTLFPAVDTSAILNAGSTMNELAITSMSVEVSTTSTFDDIYDATEDGNGYWTATGIPGLTNGEETTLYVRVVINDNTLNNNGLDGTPGDEYATFTVTPSASMAM